MALQKKTTVVSYGVAINFDNAYHQITNLNGNKDTMHMQITSFTDDSKQMIIKDTFYNFIPDTIPNAKEITTQAYDYAKTQDDFAEAIDC